MSELSNVESANAQNVNCATATFEELIDVSVDVESITNRILVINNAELFNNNISKIQSKNLHKARLALEKRLKLLNQNSKLNSQIKQSASNSVNISVQESPLHQASSNMESAKLVFEPLEDFPSSYALFKPITLDQFDENSCSLERHFDYVETQMDCVIQPKFYIPQFNITIRRNTLLFDYIAENKSKLCKLSWIEYKQHLIQKFKNDYFTKKCRDACFDYQYDVSKNVEYNRKEFLNLKRDGLVAQSKELTGALIKALPEPFLTKVKENINMIKSPNTSVEEIFEELRFIESNLPINKSLNSSSFGVSHFTNGKNVKINTGEGSKNKNSKVIRFCNFFLENKQCPYFKQKRCLYLHDEELFKKLKSQINNKLSAHLSVGCAVSE
jgi:hypothetical protein